MNLPHGLGIIAGNGAYPIVLARAARAAGTTKIVAAAFTGETKPELTALVDAIEWMRVGQLGRLINYLRDSGVHHAIMAGQIAPKHLFDLRPDMKALLLLSRLPSRNAESIFGAIADELASAGIELLPATTFLEHLIPSAGLVAGRPLRRRETDDVRFGLAIAKEISRLDIGQTVIVKNGTVLAVEGFEGTNETIRRGGALGGKESVMVKVSKPKQDLRFDVPVIGLETLRAAQEARVRVVALEAGKTLLLDLEEIRAYAPAAGLSLVAAAAELP